MDEFNTLSPGIVNEDDQSVTVRTRDGEIVPLSKSNPAHSQAIDSFRAMAPAPTPSPELDTTGMEEIPMEEVPATPPPATVELPPNPNIDTTGMTEIPMQEVGSGQVVEDIPPPVEELPDMTADSRFRATETKLTTKSTDPTIERNLNRLTESKIKAADALSKIESAEADAISTDMRQRNMEMDAQAKQEQANEAARQAKMAEKLNEISALEEKFGDMKVEDNYFARQSTGNQLLTILSLAVGGYAAPSTGGRNLPLEAFQKAIDRDIDAQKANIDIKSKQIEKKRGGYQDYLRLMGDERAAAAAEKSRIMDMYSRRAEQIAASSKSPEIQAKANLFAADLRTQSELQKAERNQIIKESITTDKPKAAATSKPSEAAEAEYEAAGRAMDSIERIRELRKDVKVGLLTGNWEALKRKYDLAGKDSTELQNEADRLAIELTKQYEGSRPSNFDAERYKKLVPSIKQQDDTFERILDEMDKKNQKAMSRMEQKFQMRGEAYLPYERPTSKIKQQRKFESN